MINKRVFYIFSNNEFIGRCISVIGQIMVCLCVYYFAVISPCWDINHLIVIRSLDDFIHGVGFSSVETVRLLISVILAGIICAVFYLLALTAALFPVPDNYRNSGSYRCVSEAMWDLIYRPRLLVMAFFTSGNYCSRQNMMTAGKNYFSGGLLSDDAIKELKDKRLFEIVSVVAIVLILVTLVGVNPQKTFWLFLCLFLLSANGIIEVIIINVDKRTKALRDI